MPSYLTTTSSHVQGLQQTSQGKGLTLETAQRDAASLLARTLETQILRRYCLSYFGLVSLGLMALLVW